MKHKFCSVCTNEECAREHDCKNNHCKVCAQIGEHITTHCPGTELTVHQRDLVRDGELDYRAGKWREGYKSRRQYQDPDQAVEMELQFLDELIEEDASKECVREVMDVIKFWREMRHIKR